MPMPFQNGAVFGQQPPPPQQPPQQPSQQPAGGFNQPPPPPPQQPPRQEPQVVLQGQQQPQSLSALNHLPDTTTAWEVGTPAWETLGQIRARHGSSSPQQTPPQQTPSQQTPSQQTPSQQAPSQQGWGGQQAAGSQQRAPQYGSPFAGIEQATFTHRNAYLEPGRYVLRTKDLKYVSGRNGDFLFLEASVEVSTYNQADPTTHGCNQIGSIVSIGLKKNESFLSNVKKLMIALSGFDQAGNPRDPEDTVSQQEVNAAISDEQPYRGALIYVEANRRQSREGNEFTFYDYWPCKANADGTPDLNSIPR